MTVAALSPWEAAPIGALDTALPTLGFRSIVSYVARDNAASLAVAARLGGCSEPAGTHPDPDVIVHRYSLNEART